MGKANTTLQNGESKKWFFTMEIVALQEHENMKQEEIEKHNTTRFTKTKPFFIFKFVSYIHV